MKVKNNTSHSWSFLLKRVIRVFRGVIYGYEMDVNCDRVKKN